jgi:PmbA protein
VRRLGSKRIKTAQVPVLFEGALASGLISHLISAISGGNLYRKSSFLLDSLGKQVMSSHITIEELPHLLKGLASSPFDNEGVATKPRALIKAGVLNGYMLSSYSARKLGMQSTGNAGGNHNLIVSHGDYSRGAAGFWVENGVIVHPVEEITIAGNLQTMLKQIVAIGNDVLVQGSKQVGSILIENMTVAGD